MDTTIGAKGRMMNRWWRAGGALLMNLPLVTNTEGKVTDDKIVNALPSAVCYAFR